MMQQRYLDWTFSLFNEERAVFAGRACIVVQMHIEQGRI